MPGFMDLHVAAPVAAALEELGWRPDDALARETAPTAARGHNLVAAVPPAPAYAGPALAGLLSRLAAAADASAGARAIVLCPAAELGEWGALVHRLGRGAGVRVQVAHGTARALRRLRLQELDLLVAAPETALDLLRRSALKLEQVAAVLLAWPERWEEEETLTALAQDLPKDAQRIIYTSDASRVTDLVERYARKALTVGVPPAETTPAAPVGPVRTVSVPWRRRAAALAELVEMLDPQTVVIWSADGSGIDAIEAALPVGDAAIRLATGADAPEPSASPNAQLIIAYDLPTHERLGQLLAAGDVVLLAPPGTESYVARIATPRRPLRLPGLADAVATAGAARRAAIRLALEAGRPEPALAVLAPLFERYDPVAVAAALYELWTAGGAPAVSGTEAAAAAPASTIAKIFVGVGKKDGATANDLVAVLTKELRVDRTKIGRIELRDGFSLVELPAAEAEQIAGAMNGTTIRRKRVVARVDRGASPRPGGGPGGGPGGPGGPRSPRPFGGERRR